MILHRKDPYNPEYIPTRIRDQQSLVYELCRANYTFHLASHVFNVHRGVKTKETNLSSAVLTHQKRLRTRLVTRKVCKFQQKIILISDHTSDLCIISTQHIQILLINVENLSCSKDLKVSYLEFFVFFFAISIKSGINK